MMLGGYFRLNIDRSKLIQYADRILYGSDYPHIPYDMETEVRAILAMDPGDTPLRKILHDNASKLFKIPPFSPK